MKTSRLVAILFPIFVLAVCFNCYAADLSSQVSSLEQRANRLQSQIDQAKAANQTMLNQQIQGLRASVDNLVRQRVQVDTQIAQLEGQIEDIKTGSQMTLNRQITRYNAELDKIKSQLAGVAADKRKAGRSDVKRAMASKQPETPKQ